MRRLVVGCELEGDVPAVGRAERHPVVFGVELGPAGEVAVEGGEAEVVRGVEHHHIELPDHDIPLVLASTGTICPGYDKKRTGWREPPPLGRMAAVPATVTLTV